MAADSSTEAPPALDQGLADWKREYALVRQVVEHLDVTDWALLTPARPWTIHHQIGHLMWTDQALLMSLTDSPGFSKLAASVQHDMGTVDTAAEEALRTPAKHLMNVWDRTIHSIWDVFARNQVASVAWFGPPMRPSTAVSARIMELFAHGQDIRDALGLPQNRSSALWHVIDLAVRSRRFAFGIHGLSAPTQPLRVEASHPGGIWAWGPEEAVNCIRATAVDLALLAVHRRNPDDLDITAAGSEAEAWKAVIQAYAGPPAGWPPAAG